MTKLLLLLLSIVVYQAVAGVLDAETGQECVDLDPVNCPFWAEQGECKANRGYMHRHCKKSCDRCRVVMVNDVRDINRFVQEKKSEIEAKRKQNDALKVLAGGNSGGEDNNGRDKKELPPPKAKTESTVATAAISSTGEVETIAGSIQSNTAATTDTTTTTKSSSSAAKTTGSSATNEKPAKKKPKMDAQTGLECVDNNENCPFWAATGECKANRGYMSVNCRLSCDRCHIVRANSANDIRNFINRKQRESEGERRARTEARKVQKILAGEL